MLDFVIKLLVSILITIHLPVTVFGTYALIDLIQEFSVDIDSLTKKNNKQRFYESLVGAIFVVFLICCMWFTFCVVYTNLYKGRMF